MLNVRTIRDALKLSRRELAEKCGVDVSTVGRWEAKGEPPARGSARTVIEMLARDGATAIASGKRRRQSSDSPEAA